MFRFPIHPMISIALKEANRVAKTSVDRRYHTLIQQRPTLYIAPELYEALQRRAKEERRSISNLCNILIEDAMQVWLDANPPEPKDPTTAVKPAAKSAAAKAKGGKGKSWFGSRASAGDRPWGVGEVRAIGFLTKLGIKVIPIHRIVCRNLRTSPYTNNPLFADFSAFDRPSDHPDGADEPQTKLVPPTTKPQRKKYKTWKSHKRLQKAHERASTIK